MRFVKSLEIDDFHYQETIDVLIKNGLRVSEHKIGSRKTIYADNQVCGFNKVDYNLPISNELSTYKLNSFLGAFTKNLYRQFSENQHLYDLKIEFIGVSRDKNETAWKKIKARETFFNVDLSSAYWQIAHKLGYINIKMFEKYMPLVEYKEAKRYCISFLARENKMRYFDGREIDVIECNTEVLYQVYENVRYELYKTINEIKKHTGSWIEYNIDGICVTENKLQKTIAKFDELGLLYKVNPCLKIDSKTYFHKLKICKF